MMIMEDSKMSKIEYDLKALMYSRCNKNTCHVDQAIYCNFQNICFCLLIDLDTLNVTKDRCPITMDTTVRLSPLNLAYGLL